MGALAEKCPHCAADMRGAEIPPTYREMYPSGATHYSRVIGVEVRGVYDGVLFWQCPDCGGKWHRWHEDSPYRERAVPYVDGNRGTVGEDELP